MRDAAAVVALVFAWLPLSAHGQAASVEYDVHIPAYSGAQDSEPNQYATSSLGVELGGGR